MSGLRIAYLKSNKRIFMQNLNGATPETKTNSHTAADKNVTTDTKKTLEPEAPTPGEEQAP